MAEIKINKVENTKSPESSTPQEIVPKDQQKLAVQDNGENNNEVTKGGDTQSKPQGEHPKLEDRSSQGNANKESKQPMANTDNKHGKLAGNDGNECQSANTSTSDGNFADKVAPYFAGLALAASLYGITPFGHELSTDNHDDNIISISENVDDWREKRDNLNDVMEGISAMSPNDKGSSSSSPSYAIVRDIDE